MALSSGYWETWTTTVNKTIGAVASREMLVQAHHARLRETGLVHGARLYFGDPTGLTGVFIKLYRINAASTFDLIGTSSNLVSLISTSTVNDLKFATPLQGQEGDYVAVRLEGNAAGTNQLVQEVSSNARTLEVTASTPGSAGFDWLSQTAVSGLVKVQLLSGSPNRIGWLGYSITGGSNAHTGFCIQTTTATDISSTSIASTIPHRFWQMSQIPFQNMSVGGQTAADLAVRVVNDIIALNCNMAFVHAGGNDALTAVTVASYTASMTTLLDHLRNHKIPTCVMAVLPGNSFTAAQATLIDGYNVALIALCATYDNVVFCDPRTIVGIPRASGPAGNLWNQRADYADADGLHYTPSAHKRIAQALHKSVRGFKLVAERG